MNITLYAFSMATWAFVLCVLIINCGYSSGLLDGGLQPTLEQKIDQLTQRVLQLEQNAQVKASTGPIAFTATLTNTIDNMGSHQHIVFDNVITNIGNAYSSFNGGFTVPVNGAYVFFVTITNIPRYSASIQLMHNGNSIGNALAHGSSTNGDLYVTSTIAATVQLAKGDQVWVQNEYSFSTVEELDGNGFSSFSGHLIAAD